MKFRLSSEYGELSPIRDHVHRGIDLAMPEGTTLRSIAEGTVERVVDFGSTNLGKGVFVRHEDGTLSIYGHMKDTSAVKVGEHVNAGDVLGLSGNTGSSTGAHLHYAIKDAKGNFLDPTPLAEEVDAISGDSPTSFIERFLEQGKINSFEHADFSPYEQILRMRGGATELIGSSLKEGAKEKAKAIIYGILAALGEVLMEVIQSVALIGGGIGIIMWAAGLKKGLPITGILFVANVLIKYVFGGV